jgi:hypothetical protein
MLAGLKAWFVALSTAGRIGIIAAVIMAGGVASAAINDNPPPHKVVAKTQAMCTSSTTTTTETQPVSFDKTTVEDPYTTQGQTYIKTSGANGVKTITYGVVTYTPSGCKENSKTQQKEEITTEPVTEVTAIGTKPKATPPPEPCDSNYSGACVPIASDVDCAGGSGNGPAYVSGPVYVIGSDIYGLDRDGDGVGCE